MNVSKLYTLFNTHLYKYVLDVDLYIYIYKQGDIPTQHFVYTENFNFGIYKIISP